MEIVPLGKENRTFKNLPYYNADTIKSIRESIGLTRVELSELMGVSVKTVQAWESGRNKPNGSSARLLQILQVSPNEFIEYMIND
ncbi:helix-turn-helix domain-containing protein [Mammaliicoccus sciuri]|uniref:helix-turn-helix domain-containing protein n=1 Tax=Mammaliicoccus sciuri TaxID=1296 RepID=UPI003F54412F